MPIAPTYPGVYIEEIPSGVRTIAGVATSITAFMGRAQRGPVNEAVRINSFRDYERLFGGLWIDSTMSYAVSDFFRNGGSQAIIVRLFKQPATLVAKLTVDNLQLEAVNPGVWGNNLTASVDWLDRDSQDTVELATQLVLSKNDLFNLTVTYTSAAGPTVERFTNVTLKDSARRVDRVLAQSSNFVRVTPWAPKFTLDNVLQFEAVSTGMWGNTLYAKADYTGRDSADSVKLAQQIGLDITDLFNLTVTYITPAGKTVERFTNLTVRDGIKDSKPDITRRVDQVLAASNLVRVAPPVAVPPATLRIPGEVPYGFEVPPKLTAAVAPIIKGADSPPLTLDTDFSLAALERVDAFNLLCIPPDVHGGDVLAKVYSNALTLCYSRRAILIVDPPSKWKGSTVDKIALTDLGLSGPMARNAAVYYPRVLQANPLRSGQIEEFVPCGIVAGIISRTDNERGVWKAPAGLDAALSGVQALSAKLTDAESGMLNPLGLNVLRCFPGSGQVIWGARTMRGSDQLGDDYKYLSVRRLALYIEESLYRGSQWVVFEPNDEPLWSQIRLNVGAFLQGLFRQGAFKGKTPNEAYYVKCDKSTTTAADINLGIVNIEVGFAPVKPAEFVVIRFQQMAGQSAA